MSMPESARPKIKMQIVPLDYRNGQQVRSVVQLHKLLLTDGYVTRLGEEFIRFYYTRLPKDNLMKCNLCQCDGKYIGFQAYTKYPFSLIREGARRNLFVFSLLLIKSLILNPLRLKVVFEIVLLGLKRKDDQAIGETLSIGVLKPYRKYVDEATGLRASQLLFSQAIDYFRKEGFSRIETIVKKSNTSSLRFHFSLPGARLKSYLAKDVCLIEIEL